MADLLAKFNGLTVTLPRHHVTKKVLRVGDVKKDEPHCGVAHLRDIQYHGGDVKTATVDLYVTAFGETNPIGKATGVTDHRVMMEKLGFWKTFEDIKGRARDEKGEFNLNFDVTREPELFYGFTRKKNVWYSTSCTLNSWIEPFKTGVDISMAQVSRDAGIQCFFLGVKKKWA